MIGTNNETNNSVTNGKVESEEITISPSQFSLGVFIIKFIVILFDILTFPLYYFIQRPWVKIGNQRKVRAVLEDSNNPYSSYVRVDDSIRNHYVFKAQTLPESQQLVLKLNPKDLPILGHRRILDVFTTSSSSGKEFVKYELSDYEWLTLEQVDQKIGELARGFLSHGVKFQDKVLIFSETRMEWFLCAQALFRISAIVTTLYPTLGLKSITHGIQETEVEHIVTTSNMLPNLLKIIDQVEFVKCIYVIEIHPGLMKSDQITQNDFNKVLEGKNRHVKLITYEQLAKIGFLSKESDFDYIRPSPDDVAVIVYTSGSTGNPKGVLLTHRNFLSSMHASYSIINQEILDEYDSHSFYGVLPLAHVFELFMELSMFAFGIRIGYGSPYTIVDDSTAIIKGQKGDLKMLKPTIMAGVPLLLDRLRRTITNRFERKKSVFWKQLIKFSIAYKNYWIDRGFDTPLINKFICQRLNGNLGGNVRFMISGGAPLSSDTHRMMRALLNIQILVGYGSSETCGASCLMDLGDLSIGYVGSPLVGVKIRLVDWAEGGYSVHDKPHPRGELVIGGPGVSQGYFKLPDKTEESFEYKYGEWWFKMGDIGEINKKGTIKIIDRKKDFIKLQFGEYISMGKIEAELKNFMYIDNVCIYGDSMHTYVIALIVPAKSALGHLAKDLNKGNLTFEQQCKDPEIISKVLSELKQFCTEVGLHKMETPQKIKLCSEEWSMAIGFLTASMKNKRREIQKFYEKDINELYGH